MGYTRKLIFIFILFIMPLVSSSQPGDPPDPTGDPVPLGGVEILLVVGGTLGLKKLVSKGKNHKN
ncbi:MAG: hypothetical protein AAF363_14345 [Bacteroidota bacterium]